MTTHILGKGDPMLHAVRPFIEFYSIASFATPAPHRRHVGRFWQGLRLGWMAARRYRQLSSLNDDQLAHRGLDRTTIGRRAFFDDPLFRQD